ncbi:EAL domain-containing protein [Paenibacillus qinlingensis]|uniref:Diguanylate cyclase (GGDEF)-like protein/PAS domain S-box-containing protein n=1 Tax=Paenibacillus qinlingensis TaxID=1837343 RepID=A0ABU1NZK8_9BACL|nr:EAL domain-containing protein [Paenibacillus qinlingensis]MDR6552734.1 diguanylate cyclase (GGDEF)-like protein/PAS domain S-box-containing protein [Paenibacillus qinlingensis]
METISSTYHVPLVIFSILIAILASFAALDLGIRIHKAKGSARQAWLAGGAFAMGMGIWSMHFVAMLAFHLPIAVTYQLSTVIYSIIPALFASWLALHIISRPIMHKSHVFIGATFIATGIVSMHYIGMEAMVMGATIVYNPFLWVLSAVIAYVVSLVALLLLFSIKQNASSPRILLKKLGSSLVMGVAICGMHYTGMAAATFKHEHAHTVTDLTFNTSLLAYLIGFGVLFILGLAFISTFIDKRFESQLLMSEKRFRSVVESAHDAIILADDNGTIISWNKGASLIFGYEEGELIGEKLRTIFPNRYLAIHQERLEKLLTTQDPNELGRTHELQGLRKDQSELPVELSLAVWKEEGSTYFSCIIRDISERKRTEEKINQMVYRDPLTGLPNRLLLNDRLELALDQAYENQQIIGIMFIDLDRFKYINDTLGHAMGDKLLIDVAKRFEANIGKGDTVSRQGGDEFIVLWANTTTDEMIKNATKMVRIFSESFNILEHELFVTPSIGISLYPSDGGDIETLIKNADTAMYRVKEHGKNNFQFYTPEMNETVTKKMQMEIGLRKALERNEFNVYYQPQIDVNSGKIIGVEALIRWQHPEWGPISPTEFIPLAEETGLIIPIGEWVLNEACRQNKDWQDQGFAPLRMAVNISSRQFKQSNLIDIVSKALDESGLNPEYLELELTESIIQDSKYAIETMHELKLMGIFLSIDDFGTGYSSLNYLKLFPIDSLKIDQSFTRNMFDDIKDAALVHTIISMAHNLDLKVIAEGVETKEQLQFLSQRECNEAQGYLFSRPVPAKEMTSIIKQQYTYG